jgi:hypothetical protein
MRISDTGREERERDRERERNREREGEKERREIHAPSSSYPFLPPSVSAGARGLFPVLDMLRQASMLTNLNMSNTGLTNQCAILLADVLREKYTLVKLVHITVGSPQTAYPHSANRQGSPYSTVFESALATRIAERAPRIAIFYRFVPSPPRGVLGRM